MAARRLTLRKDILAELTTDDLSLVAGGGVEASGVACNLTQSCVPCTGYYPSIFDPCETRFC